MKIQAYAKATKQPEVACEQAPRTGRKRKSAGEAS